MPLSEEEILHMRLQEQVFFLLNLLVLIVFPTIERIICAYYVRTPYHISLLSGQAWVQELFHGHPECIQTELGVHKHVVNALMLELVCMGHRDSKNVTLEE